MEIFGIKFAPLNTPLKRRVETLAAGIYFNVTALGGFIGLGTALYLLLYTRLWLITMVYLTWIWVFDTDICEKGGRSVQFIRRFPLWKYCRDYFPINLHKVPGAELDPKRNYLFCSFPHGIFASGMIIAFSTTAAGYHKLFPDHKPHTLTLKPNFRVPFFRDYLLTMGTCSVSESSMNWILGSPEGGNVAVLVVGGAEEAFHCRPGQYRLVLKNRKGFARVALKNGSPLVPMFSFGETDIFDQVSNPKGSLLRYLQEKFKKLTGIAPIIPLGRGFLQYSFGTVPMRKPINIIVGKPIDVEKVENPTQEQINDLHERFINELTALFEEHKHKYAENPDKAALVIT